MASLKDRGIKPAVFEIERCYPRERKGCLFFVEAVFEKQGSERVPNTNKKGCFPRFVQCSVNSGVSCNATSTSVSRTMQRQPRKGARPEAPAPKQLRPSACRQRVLRKTEEAPDLFSRFGFRCRSRGGLRNARQRRRGGLVGAATGGRERSQERFRRSWWAGRAPKRSDRA